jgi:hypothetical protein
MTKIISALILIFALFVASTNTILADGDHVYGDKGVGEVAQNGPCPVGDWDDVSPGPMN